METEVCDGEDNDCSGVVDDFTTPTTTIMGFNFDVVNTGIGNVVMMKYEASRSDADGTTQGVRTGRPCSAAGKLPWTNVTWGEASAACCALNANGQCDAGLKGWRLCDSSTWETACKGPSAACTWGYNTNCAHDPLDTTTYANTCVGGEYSSACTGGGTQCARTSGSFGQCRSAPNGGDIFDMSGNVKEWTQTAQSAGIYELRGGSYNNLESGRTCAFNFTVGNTSFRFPTTGFRCCYYP
jgi:formylglycine-generating enzyme required for sulfatase activity